MNATLLLIILLSLVGLALVCVVVLNWRRRAIHRRPGAVECSIRVGEAGSRPHWRLGVAVLTVDSFKWYPVLALRAHHSMEIPRDDLEITERRVPVSTEEATLAPGAHVVACTYGAFAGHPHKLYLALGADALAAFSSWLESSPPGLNHMMGRFT